MSERNWFTREERRTFSEARRFGLWNDQHASMWTPYDPLIHSLRSPSRPWAWLSNEWTLRIKEPK